MDKHERIAQFEARYAEDYGFEAVMVSARQRLVLEVLGKIRPRVVLEAGCGIDMLASRVQKGGLPLEQWLIVEPAEQFFNAALLALLERIAAAKRCAPAQVALAWLLAQGEDIVPMPGTNRRTYLEQNCAAAAIRLTSEEMNTLTQAFPLGVPAGTRYPEKQLAGLGI